MKTTIEDKGSSGCVDRSLGKWHIKTPVLIDENGVCLVRVVAENVAQAGFDIQPRLDIRSIPATRACKALKLDWHDGYRGALEKIQKWLENHHEAWAVSKAKTFTDPFRSPIKSALDDLNFLKIHGRPFCGQTRQKCLERAGTELKRLFQAPVGKLP